MLLFQAPQAIASASEEGASLSIIDEAGDAFSQGTKTILSASQADVSMVEVLASGGEFRVALIAAEGFPSPGQVEDGNLFVGYAVQAYLELGSGEGAVLVQLDAMLVPQPFQMETVVATLEGSWGSVSVSGFIDASRERIELVVTSESLGESYLQSLSEALSSGNTLLDLEFAVIVVDEAFNPVQTIVDEVSYVEGGEGEAGQGGPGDTATTSPGHQPESGELEPYYSVLESTDSTVSVGFSAKPTISFSIKEEDGEYVVSYSAEARGFSRGAAFVAVAIEVYYAGSLVAQSSFNSPIGPGAVDDGTPVDGLMEEYEVVMPGGMGSTSIRVAVEPGGDGWSEWFFEMSIERRIPKATMHGVEASGLERVFIEERNPRVLTSSIEAVFTVIGFSDYSGRLYAVKNEYAEITVSLSTASPSSTSTMMGEGAESKRGHGGTVNEQTGYTEPAGTSARESARETEDSGSSINPLLAAAALAATAIVAVIAVAAARLRS